LVAIILVVALRPMAIALRLVDKPDERKHHTGEVPLIGGPVIWLIVTFASIFAPNGFPRGITLAGLALVLPGTFDDHRPISIWPLTCLALCKARRFFFTRLSLPGQYQLSAV